MKPVGVRVQFGGRDWWTGKRRRRHIRMLWTCCNDCHTTHANRAAAWLHWAYLSLCHRFKRSDR